MEPEPLPLFDQATGPRRVTLVRLSAEIARATASVGRVAVEGEVVRPSRHPGGVYFTLRDRAAQVSVRCPANRLARCHAVAGERVLVTGTPTWLADRGQLQLVAEEVAPVGEGAIAALVEQVRARLASDGLLGRPPRRIPRLPRTIGVICGAEAAVRADVESVVAARFPGYPVLFVETNVSGPGAAEAVTRTLEALDERPDVDVIVLARGGGDAAQLLPFSDEVLCRAITAARTPVVSAIGHEGDRPLCDEVADLRCGTPSLAAAAVVPSRVELEAELDRHLARAAEATGRRVGTARERLARVAPARALAAGLQTARARCERTSAHLALVHPDRRLRWSGERLAAVRREVEALAPARVLERGYAVVRDGDGRVVRDPASVAAGDPLDIHVAGGRLAARAEAWP
ncbi:MAG TPA: exodeoxyribonuclease VII large subunit [Acidimicrobiales bacterium]|nr:exodeoxyribonuclease VII large subunit [Acidimicrobiales bacterium]